MTKPSSSCRNAAYRLADRLSVTAAVLTLAAIGHAQVSFTDNGQQLNNADGNDVTLGDFNGDGFLDAFVANSDDSRVYFGDGHGQFTDSGQRLTGSGSAAAADVNGDGRLEVVAGTTLWLNDGQGRFTVQAGAVETNEGGGFISKLADLNGDGRPDIFAIRNYAAMRVYLNDGSGHFRDSGQRLGDGTIGTSQVAQIALGDIDGNGTIDAVICGWRSANGDPCPNRVWLNDGLGNFRDSGQLLDEGLSHVHGFGMGDLNGDGRPDLVMNIQDAARSGRVYLNDGSGRFVGGSNLSGTRGEALALADFDGNGTLDIFAGNSSPPNRVWLNDGTGAMRDSGLRLGATTVWCWGVAAGDFNGDGKPDVFVVNSLLANTAQGAPAQIWLNTTPFRPAITTQPSCQHVTPGSSAMFSATATRDGPFSYQWKLSGAAIAGATSATYTVANVQAGNMGFYSVTVSNSVGTTESDVAILTVNAGSSRLTGLSTRGYLPAGGSLTPGFFLRGGGSKSVIVRAVGPRLGDFGVAGPLSDPRMDLIPFGLTTPLLSNDDWGTNPDLPALRAAMPFALTEGSRDAAALATLSTAVNTGYTVRIVPTGAATAGIAMAEVYDLDATTSPVQFASLATLGFTGTGENLLTPGIIITGDGPKQLLIRAVGPTLAGYGVGGVLADPQFRVVPLGQDFTVAGNDNWGGTAALQAAFTQTSAFALPADSRDAAAIVRLPPGGYTVQATGVGGTTGNVIVEVYDMDP